MSIYINGRFLLQPQTGVNRFAYEMTKAIIKREDNIQVIMPYGEVSNDYDVSDFNIIRVGKYFGRSHLWEQIILPLYFMKHNGLLLNFTSVGPIFMFNKYITIHDLAFIEHPRWYSKAYYLFYRIFTPLSALTSKQILTVSNFSKSEITSKLHIAEDKIHIIYNAVSSIFKNYFSENKVDAISEKYILAVSTLDPRKNFSYLLQAFQRWDNPNGVKLYIVGGKNAVFADMDICESSNVRWLGRVSDSELVEYYRNAQCFVYPSLYEGFGIPPLEAMACGTPVIVSNIPPHREVCADAALYVDALDYKSLVKAFEILLSDNDLATMMRNRGKMQCERFSWTISAERLLEVVSDSR